eukprot:TRINITY_DN976_c0_g1_i2.p1 TRINITY_DN976_c0_g1~~TRINITY_DN976_c0_g1_i2.p1  ORF type:complete len:160 (-),score=38.84 TRINITY_DN976_c0_g1_i2:459-938(-)
MSDDEPICNVELSEEAQEELNQLDDEQIDMFTIAIDEIKKTEFAKMRVKANPEIFEVYVGGTLKIQKKPTEKSYRWKLQESRDWDKRMRMILERDSTQENHYTVVGIYGKGHYETYRDVLDDLRSPDSISGVPYHCFDGNQKGDDYRRGNGLGDYQPHV